METRSKTLQKLFVQEWLRIYTLRYGDIMLKTGHMPHERGPSIRPANAWMLPNSLSVTVFHNT